MKMDKVAVVTGSSSGIGYETSLLLARSEFHTYATMRNLDKSKGILEKSKKEGLPLQALQLDVNDDRSVKNAVDRILKEKKRIDLLVNNAGYGLGGSVEELSIEELKAQFETNLFGMIRTSQAVLPTMRKQKSGVIVNVSSVAGRMGMPLMSAYVGTKFAVEGLSESMRYELAPFGIKVVVIEPGAVGTNFMNAVVMAKKASDPTSPYVEIMQKVYAAFGPIFQKSTPPGEVAKVILQAAKSENPETRYLVGKDAADWMQARKNMSDKEFEEFTKKLMMS